MGDNKVICKAVINMKDVKDYTSMKVYSVNNQLQAVEFIAKGKVVKTLGTLPTVVISEIIKG